MANRRCLHALTRLSPSLLPPLAARNLKYQSLNAIFTSSLHHPDFSTLYPHFPIARNFQSLISVRPMSTRYFSSETRNSDDEEDEDEDEDDDEEEDYENEEEGEGDRSNDPASNCFVRRVKSPVEKEQEAEAIGYKVIGPLHPSEHPFKLWEPVFAVVQIGSHQFKVSNGDSIFTERLKHCEVNDKLILSKVLMLGSSMQTIIGRPILPDAAVHAVVEEHALDAKVIIFKKKRRKNYRRTKGHRQELTKLRITDIQGIEKPQKAEVAA